MTPSPISYEDWQKEGQYFSFNRHRVFYKDIGQGIPLLLLHGFPTCSWDWSWITGTLEHHFHMLIPDMMDSGASKNPYHKAASVMDQVDMLEALMEQTGLTAVHILAHDVGDTLAQELLARQQERKLEVKILSVTYLNGGIIPDLHRPTDGQKKLAGPFGGLVARFVAKEKMLDGFAGVFGEETRPDTDMLNAFWPTIVGSNGRASLRRRIRYIEERRENAHRWVGAIKGATVPQHMINGVEDPVSGGHVATELERRASTVKVTRLAGIGHYPQVEDPEAVVGAFMRWHRDRGTLKP